VKLLSSGVSQGFTTSSVDCDARYVSRLAKTLKLIFLQHFDLRPFLTSELLRLGGHWIERCRHNGGGIDRMTQIVSRLTKTGRRKGIAADIAYFQAR
jgi:hypothetical protein